MNAIIATIKGLSGEGGRGLTPVGLVSLAHGATHWIHATYYVLLPFIALEFGLSYTQTGSLMTLFYVSTFLTNVASGPIVDLTGRSVALQIASLLISGAALVVLGLSANPIGVAVTLILIGISISMWHPPSISYLSRCYPKSRGLALSIHTVGASFGDVIAPPIAGFLMTVLAWRETALVNAAPLFVMALVVFVVLKELERPKREAGATKLSTRYLEGARLLVRDRSFQRLCVMSGLWSMSQNGVAFFLPLYLVGDLDAGPAEVGLALAAMQIGAVFTGPIAGAWSDRIGRRPVVITSLTIGAAAIAALPFIDAIVPFVAVAAIVGCALYSMRPVVHSWTMDLAGAQTSGSAVSMVFAFQAGMMMLLPVIGGLVADIWGLSTVFHLMMVTCFAAAVLAWSMPNSGASPASATA
ncbi:MAG: MFS transporter [Rhizobiales bacterium]|nr:MFS transporter [Hyphomicrobiales bacterium]